MQTQLAPFAANSPLGQEAEKILRQCVHCGFCTATCPTYQLLGDELDGPRGRIYLLKQFLEGQETSSRSRDHLDRCLNCRSCETTCPSGVKYGRLLELGGKLLDQQLPRPLGQRLKRRSLSIALSDKNYFAKLLKTAQLSAPLLPSAFKEKLPDSSNQSRGQPWPEARHARKMVILDGCVQPSLGPNINLAAARLLDRLGISLIRLEKDGCCGAVSHHLGNEPLAQRQIKHNIDLWWEQIKHGVEAIVTTASGCGAFIHSYPECLPEDDAYRIKAEKLASLCKDIGEVVAAENLDQLDCRPTQQVSYHPPCTLQHWQSKPGLVESLLGKLGFELNPLHESHLCCGSAGSYSLLQPEISVQLRSRKLENLTAQPTEVILSSNIGCINHLQSGTQTPVKHWVELVEACCNT